MKIKILTLLAVCFAMTTLKAQNKTDIQHIKDIYYKVKEDIAFSKEHKFEGSLYCDMMEKNVNGKSWSAIGEYRSKVQFWYDEDPDMSDDEDPRNALKIVVENTSKANTRTYYAEYLFDKGKLIFVFYKRNAEEIRFYFKDNGLIHQIGTFEEYTPTEKEIQHNGEIYMKTFLSSFGVWNE